MQITLQPSSRTKVKKIKMIIEGELTISFANEFSKRINSIIKDYEILDIHLKNILNIDITFLQLFVSLIKYNEDKQIKIIEEFTSEQKVLLKKSGFENLFTNKTFFQLQEP